MTIDPHILHGLIDLGWACLCGGLLLGVFWTWLRVNKIERR